MMRTGFALFVVLLLIAVSCAFGAEKAVEGMLPGSCPAPWRIEGKPSVYTRENLYKYIDGEAELYMPYGFKKAATAMYAKPGSRDAGIVVNIFEMASLLDAFGIYGNYRSPSADQVKAGTEGFGDESQVMFYQDRYFVQIQASGSIGNAPMLFLDCASAVGKNLPADRRKPAELGLLQVPGLVPRSEKYYPEGLLGYGFFGRGLTAEVEYKGQRVKAVVALAGSEQAAKKIMADYANHLKQAKVTPEVSSTAQGMSLRAVDPLYKASAFQQSGRYVVGVTGLKDTSAGGPVVTELVKRLPKR